MPMVTTTKILFCFTSMLVLNAKTVAEPKIPNETKNSYQDTLYIFTYIFLWNFLIEISLITVLHFKQTKNYKENHLFINLLIIVGQMINNLILLKKEGFSEFTGFLQIELLLSVFEIFQILLGFDLIKKMGKKDFFPNLLFLKFMHRIIGFFVYFGRKYQMFFYLYNFLMKTNFVVPIVVITFLAVLTVTTHLFVFLLINKTEYDLEKKNEFLMYDKKNGFYYKELLRKIENLEYIPKSSNLRISLLDKNTRDEIEKKQKEEKWVIIENFVYSLKNFSHPLGDFLFEGIAGKDITREFYGLKNFRFSNKKLNLSQNFSHKHSDRTNFFLNKNCIGEISPETYIESYIENNNSISNSTDSLKMTNLDKSENFYKSKKEKKLFHWSVDTSYNFSKQNSLFFIKKCEKDTYINLSTYWLNFFGKYFLLQNADKKTYMYPALSLSPTYIQKKHEWLQTLKSPLKKTFLQSQNPDLKEIGNMYLVLQQQLDSQQRSLTESDSELKTCYLPLLTKNAAHFSPLNEGQKFRLQGPLGFGLDIAPQSCEKVLFVIKDEGIFAFLDFLEFLGQKALVELGKSEVSHPVFTEEYFYAFTNEPEFHFLFEVSEKFFAIAEICGILQFGVVESVYKEDVEGVVKRVVRNVKICVNGKGKKGVVRSFTNEVAEDFGGVLRILEGDTEFERVFVSGDQEFGERVMNGYDGEGDVVFL